MLEGLAVATCLPPGRVIFGNWEKFTLPTKREQKKIETGEAVIEAERHVEGKEVCENKILSSEGSIRGGIDVTRPCMSSHIEPRPSRVKTSNDLLQERAPEKLESEKDIQEVSSDFPAHGQALLTNLTVDGEVWFVPESWRSLHEKLQLDLLDLSQVARQSSGGSCLNLKVGERVLACWEDGCWYRGRVTQLLQDDLLEVFFVDWGNIELMEMGEVVRMKDTPRYEQVGKVRDLAVQGFLHKVSYY